MLLLSDRTASDMEVCMEQRHITEFLLHGEEMAHSDIHQHLLNIHGDPAADVSTVRWWVVHFSSSNMKDKPCSGWLCTAVSPQNEEQLHQFTQVSWLTTLCWKILFCSWKSAQSGSVIVLFASAGSSLETNRSHYFQSNLHTCFSLSRCGENFCWRQEANP